MWNSQQPITDMEGAFKVLFLGYLIVKAVASQAPNYGSHFVPGAVSEVSLWNNTFDISLLFLRQTQIPNESMGWYNASPIQSPESPHQSMKGHAYSSYVPGAVSWVNLLVIHHYDYPVDHPLLFP